MKLAVPHLSKLVALAVLLCGAPSTAAAAQEPPPPAGDGPAPIERLAEWPKLESSVASTVKLDVERLKRSNTPEMGEQAHAALVAVGAGAAPELLVVLGRERDAQARLRLVETLDAITGAPHTRLLAESFADKSIHVRTWALRRCGAFPDAGVRKGAEEALARVTAQKAKKPDAEGVDDELYAAALCATAAGSLAGFDVIAQHAQENWGKRGAELRVALEGARGEEAVEKALPLIAGNDRKKLVAGLNLLAGCGTRAAVAKIAPHLDSSDNSVRIAAINAMRGIVDGAPPIDKLSAFDAIEMAKQWKARAN